ncbi:MAG: hypothetical protein AAGI07_09145 [Bacteroidota bacterium]
MFKFNVNISWFVILLFTTIFSISCSKKNVSQGYANSRSSGQAAFSSKKKIDFQNKTTGKFKPKTKRQLRKEESMKTDPRYTDHLYFGHKKPPKKRPVGKQKLCKECGIRH